MGFGHNLIALREQRNISRKELAQALGIPYTTLRNYETEQREPGHKLLIEIAQMFNVSIDFLVGNVVSKENAPSISDEAKDIAKRYDELDKWGKTTVKAVINTEHERVSTETAPEPQISTTRIIPLYLSPAAAGYTSPIFGEDYEDYEVPASADADYAVRIDGDSMEPYIKDKSIVLVKKTVDLKIGDVGIFSVDNDMYCKQYCQDHIGNVYLFSLNRKRKDADITIWNNSGQTLWCFGKVLMKKRVPLPTGRDI
jgi:repressor LexA